MLYVLVNGMGFVLTASLVLATKVGGELGRGQYKSLVPALGRVPLDKADYGQRGGGAGARRGSCWLVHLLAVALMEKHLFSCYVTQTELREEGIFNTMDTDE
jgi:hypothetical protein